MHTAMKSGLVFLVLSATAGTAMAAEFQAGDTAAAAAAPSAQVDSARAQAQGARHRRQLDVLIGICAGQKLAAAGVEAPVPQAGQNFVAPDEAIKSQVKAAVEECYTQITGRSVQNNTNLQPNTSLDPPQNMGLSFSN